MSALFSVLALLLHISCGQGKCPDRWISYHTSCYYLFEDLEEWIGADGVCRLYQGHLVIMETKDENAFVKTIVNHTHVSNDVWIGANDMMLKGDFRWVGSNSKVAYTDWYPGEPDNHSGRHENCVMMTHSAKGWADGSCYGTHYYMCEKSQDDDLLG